MSLSRFERELLASGKTSAPSAERRQAAKVAVMRAAGVAAAAATLTASSTAAGATAGAAASATATSGVKALGLVKLVLLAVVAASAIGAVAVVTLRSSAPTAPTMIAAPDVSAAMGTMGQNAGPSAAPATHLDDSPPAIASVPVSSLPNAPASAFAPASARTAPSPAASAAVPVPREPATEEDPLATEARILEAARACLAKGDRACAQAKLDEHEARFARGPLADEAALLAIDVALAGGDRPKARRLARSLVARSPHGAWNARVKALAQEEDGPP